ncbi:hypothetical protein [Mycobacterium sp. shizuoka-1]|uniref:hypothetical protein n=1 Tax=Mycobacterium sp. shizuoka-1 TaxID=2039281 RepID=UPI000C063AAC|nr:hypothetical protein [Mycobacterium sp. shizuoka-1]GAY14491.1 hypothetical protein MSZK_12170 [Mycobacterium sp. shizuoka-1]
MANAKVSNLPAELFDLSYVHHDEVSARCLVCGDIVEIGASWMRSDKDRLDVALAHRAACPLK